MPKPRRQIPDRPAQLHRRTRAPRHKLGWVRSIAIRRLRSKTKSAHLALMALSPTNPKSFAKGLAIGEERRGSAKPIVQSHRSRQVRWKVLWCAQPGLARELSFAFAV